MKFHDNSKFTLHKLSSKLVKKINSAHEAYVQYPREFFVPVRTIISSREDIQYSIKELAYKRQCFKIAQVEIIVIRVFQQETSGWSSMHFLFHIFHNFHKRNQNQSGKNMVKCLHVVSKQERRIILKDKCLAQKRTS